MKYFSMRFLISWLLALAKASSDDSEVLVLTSANFDQAIADHKYLLVEFCKFLPVFSREKFGVLMLDCMLDN